LGFALAGFGVALRPSEAPLGGRPDRPVRRLGRWPFFWAGVVLLGYIAVQACNPSWRFVASAGAWWLVPMPHVAWLPTSVAAPFARSNSWRTLVIVGSLWLLACSVRIGFQRRNAYRFLFAVLIANAALLAAFGMAERISGTARIFWAYVPANADFVASFIYRNHAGAYFNLMIALASGLALWHLQRVQRRKENPAKTIVFAFSAGFIALMVVYSSSRMAIFLLAALGAAITVISGLTWWYRDSDGARGREVAGGLAVIAACLAIGAIALRDDAVWSRLAELANDPAATMADRTVVRQAAEKMLADHWVFGWGGGCFRYGFPLYSQHYPSIYQFPSGLRKYWEHAHDDLLEIPIEFGAAGVLPIALALAYGVPALLRRRFWANPVCPPLLVGCVLTLAHAWLDFVFQSPAVLFTWTVLLVGASRWSELDQPSTRRRLNQRMVSIRARDAASPP
jgi:hypothetical protein